MEAIRRLLIAVLASLAFVAPHTTANGLPAEVRLAAIEGVPSAKAARQILEIAYQRLGVGVSVMEVPTKRALLLADNGGLDGDLYRVDAVASNYPNLVRVEFPLLQGKLLAVVRETENHDLPHSPKNQPLRVSVLRGAIIAEDKARELGMEPILADDYDQVRSLLELGRVDVAFVSDVEGISPLTNEHWHRLKPIRKPVTTFTFYHYLNQRHAVLADHLAKVLEQLEREGIKAEVLESFRRDQHSKS
ncbi:MAG: transporter substrate-binding domain-containing protein [Pseudomonadales bacterium]|uniref:hypothetical protein n=1 Tax=Marinobacter nauticus TaxID=2743 RepID=UPI0024329B4A|nr:hypothetical protein [Marinobacter nauticus]MCG8520824.1 transporter substrate-binding domain-containing protein [Pseudomonadales bacterium]